MTTLDFEVVHIINRDNTDDLCGHYLQRQIHRWMPYQFGTYLLDGEWEWEPTCEACILLLLADPTNVWNDKDKH